MHDRILERAEGNPFFLEEIVRRLIDGGLIERVGDRWRATEGIEEVEIPDTVQAVLAARIDLLEPADKRIAQAAAVVGRVFWPGPVAGLTGAEPADLDDALRRLEDRELVFSRPGSSLAGPAEYIFKHVLTRDVAYESLPRKERARAHATVAGWLERTAGDRAASSPRCSPTTTGRPPRSSAMPVPQSTRRCADPPSSGCSGPRKTHVAGSS